MTPEEAWSGKRPTITHMRVFGCIAYAKVRDAKRTKLDAKGTKCLFLGYCEGTKAYRLNFGMHITKIILNTTIKTSTLSLKLFCRTFFYFLFFILQKKIYIL